MTVICDALHILQGDDGSCTVEAVGSRGFRVLSQRGPANAQWERSLEAANYFEVTCEDRRALSFE